MGPRIRSKPISCRRFPSRWSELATRSRTGAAAAIAVVALVSSTCQAGSPSPPTAPEPAAEPARNVQPAPDVASGPASRPRSKVDEPNTTDGIYSEAQAGRGRQVFEQICTECHVPADWMEPTFLDRWEEASVFRLWYWIYERMPHGNPGSLTREQVTDALTYIFQLNGLPPGPDELADDDDSIDDYWIIWTPS